MITNQQVFGSNPNGSSLRVSEKKLFHNLLSLLQWSWKPYSLIGKALVLTLPGRKIKVRILIWLFSNMINSVKSDFSVMPRCNGNEIGLFEILDKLILSTRSDPGGGDGNHQQCLAVYHHREVKCRLLVVGDQ